MEKISERKIVVVNQASNYLTIGFCNAFAEKFTKVALITGSIHVQGEELNPDVEVTYINKWVERPSYKKFLSYIMACFKIYWLLLTKHRKYEVFFCFYSAYGLSAELDCFQSVQYGCLGCLSRCFQDYRNEGNSSCL